MSGAAKDPAPSKPEEYARDGLFTVRNVIDPKTGVRHTLKVSATADGARNLGPAFYAMVARFVGGVAWESLPAEGRVLAESYARIKAQVTGLDPDAERLLLGDQIAAMALGEALLRFELRWFRLDHAAGGNAPAVATVETPWSRAAVAPAS